MGPTDGDHTRSATPPAFEGLLVLDYPGRRPEAPVSALRLEDAGYRPLPLLTPPLPVEVTGRAYAERLAAPQAAAPWPQAILAYCAASAIGVHYARLIGERDGRRPGLVLFDPEPTDAGDVVAAYHAAIRQVPAAGPEAPEPDIHGLLEHPTLLLDKLRDDLSQRVAAALRHQGLGEDAAAKPVAHFTRQHLAYLAHLLAARGPLPQGPRVGPILQVLSRDHPDHRGWLPGTELSTVRIDTDRAALLAHPVTRAAVLSFLRRAEPPEATHSRTTTRRHRS